MYFESEGRRRVVVGDARALSAFAHPLRLRLLRYLMRSGEGTASQCAKALDESPSNCSYHLRLLSRHGLVQRVESSDGLDGRDRPWRATATGFDFLPDPDDPASLAAHSALLSAELAELMRLLRHYLDNVGQVEESWRAAAVFHSYQLNCTPAELAHLTQLIDLLVRPYILTNREDAPRQASEASLSIQAIAQPEDVL
jgi:DNA-binding MarR family transcriptional regulator